MYQQNVFFSVTLLLVLGSMTVIFKSSTAPIFPQVLGLESCILNLQPEFILSEKEGNNPKHDDT
jgi:hypothetical protein